MMKAMSWHTLMMSPPASVCVSAKKRCHLKDKCVTVEQTSDHNPGHHGYVTYYKPCSSPTPAPTPAPSPAMVYTHTDCNGGRAWCNLQGGKLTWEGE